MLFMVIVVERSASDTLLSPVRTIWRTQFIQPRATWFCIHIQFDVCRRVYLRLGEKQFESFSSVFFSEHFGASSGFSTESWIRKNVASGAGRKYIGLFPLWRRGIITCFDHILRAFLIRPDRKSCSDESMSKDPLGGKSDVGQLVCSRVFGLKRTFRKVIPVVGRRKYIMRSPRRVSGYNVLLRYDTGSHRLQHRSQCVSDAA